MNQPCRLRRRGRHLVLAVACVAGPAAHAGSAGPDKGSTATPEQPGALDMTFGKGDAPVADGSEPQPFWQSELLRPTRVTLAHELSYKTADPQRLLKDRASLRVEYAKPVLEHCFVQLDAKQTVFLGKDHRRDPEGSDGRVSQAYLQTSFDRTSVSVGIQTVAWGESILAPITDEVSPRDNRELFNFNLEELRVGQPMVGIDQYLDIGRISAFYTPRPAFNRNPEKGSAYHFEPLGGSVPTVRSDDSRVADPEYGVNWRGSFGKADVSVMAARLTDNDFALHLDEAGRLVQEKQRFSLAGMTLSYTAGQFLVKTEVGWKSPKAFNDAQMQIVRKSELDAYLGVEYRHSSTLSVGLEGVNQHIVGWGDSIQGVPRNRQSLLFTATKLLMNDDLNIGLMVFLNRPYASSLTMLTTTFKWNDNLTFSLNAAYPSTSSPSSGLWNVRDQKQLAFKVQYQF